ncbi:hypothetical protein M422DRAFT_269337 [Sphaerobolus stellatus SS14]|uniref:Uncharacterized protein n=1 Tax=Sphaerobolus stellatus (strain SS14) TaxID=990650 RepID=A0A0C9TIA4_SPHS4|nr:hypothetical protein M422DRAFT_269337 [Sphaerobolus stellatus SS14]
MSREVRLEPAEVECVCLEVDGLPPIIEVCQDLSTFSEIGTIEDLRLAECDALDKIYGNVLRIVWTRLKIKDERMEGIGIVNKVMQPDNDDTTSIATIPANADPPLE